MNIQRIAAFTYHHEGGNPAGVAILEQFPADIEMQTAAARIGYSETAFLMPFRDGWRIRYFAPETEVPFCGHATIASGAVLAAEHGSGHYRLYLNDGEISLEVRQKEDGHHLITLQSPPTSSHPAASSLITPMLALFHLSPLDLDEHFPVRVASAGAQHLILVLKDRSTLAAMRYDFDATQALMRKAGLTTVSLIWIESSSRIHARNAFASGGVYEDPATGAAAAALAGYLRDLNWNEWNDQNRFEIIQGEDMGVPCRLLVEFDASAGSSVRVSGTTRVID
ncbi:PhzF family phenazine biosynthesis protein [Gynuella sunshinyii]|uniref:Putative epimerase, PhzC/PhzF-like protein n=1 Tax=Gynuella sunshinyii YC6258 TaxID=1445510 RepID=A0A0C5VLU3_9GAMM|nr:PhzF family phenazine biosynthesis protein [Gynuella sunshinyii]AJQ94313.1 putative epimerase, PhzC/PhzF-like protein [Gynuella sunshinyii YC6258]